MTIVVGGTYVVDAGAALTFTSDGSAAYALELLGYPTAPGFTDEGSIDVASPGGNTAAVAITVDNLGWVISPVVVAQGASLTVSGTGFESYSYAVQVLGNSRAAVTNAGLIQVSSESNATGVSAPTEFLNSGQLLVSGGTAEGVALGGATFIVNSGLVQVNGGGHAQAFDNPGFGRNACTVINTGTITASASAGPSYAFHGEESYLFLANSGVITAQYAIDWNPIHLFNSGTINGVITTHFSGFGVSPHGGVLVNTGTINGEIHFENSANNLYDGRGGSQTGGIFLDSGFDTVFLGNEGESVTGGSGAAVVFGGSGADTIVGGPGNDVISGGGGADLLTGGSGADIFLVRSAIGTAVVTDFSDAQGDRIDFSYLGTFNSLSDVLAHAAQSGADTVIGLGAGSLILENVTLASLTAADFTFPTSYAPVAVTSQSVSGSNIFEGGNGGNGAYQVAANGSGSLYDSGFILVEDRQDGDVAVGALVVAAPPEYSLPGTTLDVTAGSSFAVTASGANSTAYGLECTGFFASLQNDGEFVVSATGRAVGASLAGQNNVGNFENTGDFQVMGNVAHGLDATATPILEFNNGVSSLTNIGHMTVSGEQEAAGFDLSGVLGGLSNSGLITVTASAGAAYGVEYGGQTYGNWPPLTIVNSGEIQAQYAIYAVPAAGTGEQPLLRLTNTGIIDGEIHLGQGIAHSQATLGGFYDDQIQNTGQIHGAIYLASKANDLYDGRGGAQTGGVYLGGGFDLIYLGDGGETVYAGAGGNATVLGGAGDDTIHGGAGNDLVEGGLGDDLIDGGGGTNTASYAHASGGVVVNLVLQGQAQNTGAEGSDTLTYIQNLIGSAFTDQLTGDAGDNLIDGDGGDDVINAGGGTNTLLFASAASGVTVSLARQGQAQSTGVGSVTAANFQNLTGSPFNDTLEGDANNNILDGGGGTDTVTYAHAASGVTVSLDLQGQAQNTGGAGIDTLLNFHNLTGSAFDDTLEGFQGFGFDGPDNVLDGGGGVNTVSFAHGGNVIVSLALQGQDQTITGVGTLYNFQNVTGSPSNDTVEGDGGNNVLDGGGGTNTVSYAHAASGVNVSLAFQGQGQNTGGAGVDTLINFQNLTGSPFNDTLEGAFGGRLDGGGGVNTLSYAHAGAGVTVDLSLQGYWPQATGAEGDQTLVNFQNVTGSAFNDVLGGDGGNNALDGGGGNDTASYASATAGVTVSLALQGQAQDTIGAGIDTLSNFSNLVGSAHSDHLTGDANNNVIDGGGGDDVLDGAGGTNAVTYAGASTGVHVSLALQNQAQNTGAGTDTLTHFQTLIGSNYGDLLGAASTGASTLTGGTGADIFRVTTALTGAATVSDFSQAQGDKIDLGAFGSLRAFSDVVAAAQQVGSDTVITLGTGTLTLTGITLANLTASDFVLPLAAHASFDLTGDHRSDLLFRNPASGDWGYAAMTATGFSWRDIGVTSAAYAIDGTGDFNGDGVADILFHNHVSGDWGFAAMTASGGVAWHGVGVTSAAYSIDATGDFNGDGVADILFRNHATGDWGFAAMDRNGGLVWNDKGVTTLTYSIDGTGDFNGDGVADVLLRNHSTGDWGFAALDRNGGVSWNDIGITSTAYPIAGLGDFNGDGTTDVLFRNPATGDWGYMAMHRSGAPTWVALGASTTSYAIDGTGDFNGDGTSDVVFRNHDSGDWGWAAMHPNGSFDWQPMGASSAAYFVG